MPLASLRRVRSRQERQALVDERGVALVEFALVLPLLLLVILGIVDFGKAFGYKNQETHLANEAARYAAVNSCAACDSAGKTINQFVKDDATPSELRNGLVLTIAFTDPTPKNHCIGSPVKVTINYTYKFFGFLKLLPVTVGASSTMRLEKNWGDSNGNYRPDDFTPGSATDRYTATGASPDSCT
jgi:Flp pilus assembly protein TadG